MARDEQRSYCVRHTAKPPELDAGWTDSPWSAAQTAHIDNFHPQSSGHRPVTRARFLYDANALYGIFHVQDRYVRCVHTQYQGDVYKDSCVELFVQPKVDCGYMNFEMNCGGALLASYVEDPARLEAPTDTGVKFAKATRLPQSLGSLIEIYSSMPAVVDPEIDRPVEWTLSFRIAFEVIEEYVGPLGDVANQSWPGNMYKCAEACSHPHWAAWSPIGDQLEFHQPDKFAPVRFGPRKDACKAI